MIDNRSQVGIFLILGFVLLVAAGFVYVIYGYEQTDIAEESLTADFFPNAVKNYLESCLTNAAKEGVAFVSNRGGYFNLPKHYYNNSFNIIPYYFYEDSSYMPSIKIVESSISDYLKSKAPNCFEELVKNEKAINMHYNIAKINTKIVKDSVIIDLQISTEIKSGGKIYRINKYELSLEENRIHDAYNFSRFVIEKQMEDKYSICLSCITIKAMENNLFAGIENIGNNTFIFSVVYYDSKNMSHEFIFANKYKKVSCESLPIGTNEIMLRRFIKDCINQKIKRFEYSINIADMGAVNVRVGNTSNFTIDANGHDLIFAANTDLFSIDNKTGFATFTPTAENLGFHTVLIEIKDGFGNIKLKNIYLNVTR